jgi:threonine dehydrogenase-like Zn-dependent dehydrogenase
MNRGIRIVGAFGRGTAFRRALALLPTMRVARLIPARFSLAHIADAFANAIAGRGAKTVITPNR